jgi:LPS-assembly lipoprotein
MHSRRVILGLTATLLILASGCTVRPLHSSAGLNAGLTKSVSIQSVDTRVEQQVRNRLLFLLNGGERQPAAPDYIAQLTVSSSTSGILKTRNTNDDSDNSASRVTLRGVLSLSSSDGEIIGTYRRSAIALFDRSTQQFANARAEIDAQNRAADELAETFRAILLTKIPAGN